jgi:hypothetical protein
MPALTRPQKITFAEMREQGVRGKTYPRGSYWRDE